MKYQNRPTIKIQINLTYFFQSFKDFPKVICYNEITKQITRRSANEHRKNHDPENIRRLSS